ncbi:MAG: hypothetical protein ACT4P0_07625 [Panacagrimonas sp.]
MLHPISCVPALVPVAAAAALAAGFALPAHACSTCKCGDYTINLLGTEKPFSNRFRIGVDTLVRSETQGAGLAQRDTDEWRTLLGLAWSVNENLTLAAQVPWVRKEVENRTLARAQAQGLGDIDLFARYVLYRGGSGSGRHLAGVRLGVRLPTADEVEVDGEKVDIDAQPDAGSTAPNLGGWYAYFRFPWFATASVNYFHFSDGHQDIAPGDAVGASLLGQYGFNQTVAVQLGIDARYAEKNQFSGVDDPDSGGTLAMAYAGVAIRALDELVVNAAIQAPFIEELHGRQQEDPVFRLGLAYDF